MNILLSIVQFNSKLQIELNWIIESTDNILRVFEEQHKPWENRL